MHETTEHAIDVHSPYENALDGVAAEAAVDGDAVGAWLTSHF